MRSGRDNGPVHALQAQCMMEQNQFLNKEIVELSLQRTKEQERHTAELARMFVLPALPCHVVLWVHECSIVSSRMCVRERIRTLRCIL